MLKQHLVLQYDPDSGAWDLEDNTNPLSVRVTTSVNITRVLDDMSIPIPTTFAFFLYNDNADKGEQKIKRDFYKRADKYFDWGIHKSALESVRDFLRTHQDEDADDERFNGIYVYKGIVTPPRPSSSSSAASAASSSSSAASAAVADASDSTDSDDDVIAASTTSKASTASKASAASAASKASAASAASKADKALLFNTLLSNEKANGKDTSESPTVDNCSEFIWFFDLEVHNSWPSRNICQLTAVRSDGLAFFDEYIHYRPLHHSYYQVMLYARIAVSQLAESERPKRKLQLSPWDDPSAAIQLSTALLRWLRQMRDNSVVVYMGSTDPSVIMLNLYENQGLAQAQGVLQLMRQKNIITAKFLDVRKYTRGVFRAAGVPKEVYTELIPGGTLSGLFRKLFIGSLHTNDTFDVTDRRINEHFRDALPEYLTSHTLTDGDRSLRVHHTRSGVPIWHTAHTDALILMNVVAALACVSRQVRVWDAEDRKLDRFMKDCMRFITITTHGFTTHNLRLPNHQAASLYLALVTKKLIHPSDIASASPQVVDLKDDTAPVTNLFYQAKRSNKSEAYKDFNNKKLTMYPGVDSWNEANRAAFLFDPSALDVYLSKDLSVRMTHKGFDNRKHDPKAASVMAEPRKPSKRKEMSAKLLAFRKQIQKSFGVNADTGLNAALAHAENTRSFQTWMRQTEEMLAHLQCDKLEKEDLPIYYLNTHSAGKTSVVLHNQWCHMLYDIDETERLTDLFFQRVPRADLKLFVYVPTDQLFQQLTPIFCKQCKRYVGDADPGTPHLLDLKNQLDKTSTQPFRWKWDEGVCTPLPGGIELVAWPVSYSAHDISSEDELIVADNFRNRPISDVKEYEKDYTLVIEDEKANIPVKLLHAGKDETDTDEDEDTQGEVVVVVPAVTYRRSFLDMAENR
jgi:hypothetical protein